MIVQNNNSKCDKKKEGRYANYLEVGHNAFEFVLDFGQKYPENDQAELCIRIITTPIYAKAFFKTLKDSIEQYKEEFEVNKLANKIDM